MTKARIRTHSRAGTALRKVPYILCMNEVLQYVANGTSVSVNEKDIVSDYFGDNIYVKVRLESGKEGYILYEALEAV